MTSNDSELPPSTLFTEHFSTLKEPKRTTKGNFKYPLDEILFLTISAIIGGFDDWDDIVYYSKLKIDWLRHLVAELFELEELLKKENEDKTSG